MTASLIRQYLTLIENEDDTVSFFLEVHSQNPLVLRESRSTLMEGPLLDKIKATTQAVVNKYHDVQYSLLATVTTKALDLFQQNPQVTPVLQRVLQVGRVAAQNRALISILCGIVGTLIGLASNPALAAKASAQIDHLLHGDMDALIADLQKSGLHLDMSAQGLEGLPPEMDASLKKLCAAVRAMHDYQFTGSVESTRGAITNITVEANVEVAHDRVWEDITLMTPDRKFVLMHTHTEVVDGHVTTDQSEGAIMDLSRAADRIPQQYRAAADAFMNQNLPAAEGAARSVSGFQLAADTVQDNWGKFASAVAGAALAHRIQGRAKIRIDQQGVTVLPEH